MIQSNLLATIQTAWLRKLKLLEYIPQLSDTEKDNGEQQLLSYQKRNVFAMWICEAWNMCWNEKVS